MEKSGSYEEQRQLAPTSGHPSVWKPVSTRPEAIIPPALFPKRFAQGHLYSNWAELLLLLNRIRQKSSLGTLSCIISLSSVVFVVLNSVTRWIFF
jgi:hypothetical protein